MVCELWTGGRHDNFAPLHVNVVLLSCFFALLGDLRVLRRGCGTLFARGESDFALCNVHVGLGSAFRDEHTSLFDGLLDRVRDVNGVQDSLQRGRCARP